MISSVQGSPQEGSVDGVTRVLKLRVRGTVRVLNDTWVEVSLQIRLNPDAGWMDLTPGDRPLLVARRFGGKDHTRESRELYVISAMKQTLTAGGATVFELAGSEAREGDRTTEYRYWAHLGARLTVGVRCLADGHVQVLGLA